MPTINKREVKEKPVKYKNKGKGDDFYNSLAWKRLRNTFISLHPLCQECLNHDHVEPATEVHHAVPFNRGKNEEEKWELFLDEKNLISVCEKCHLGLHNKDRQYNLGRLDSLTETEYNYIHNLNY